MLTMFATKPILSNADKTTMNKEGKGVKKAQYISCYQITQQS